MKIEFDFSDDYDNYITKYLPLIQDGNDDRSDILTNKNSKFVFHNFDSHLNSENKPGQPVRNM